MEHPDVQAAIISNVRTVFWSACCPHAGPFKNIDTILDLANNAVATITKINPIIAGTSFTDTISGELLWLERWMTINENNNAHNANRMHIFAKATIITWLYDLPTLMHVHCFIKDANPDDPDANKSNNIMINII